MSTQPAAPTVGGYTLLAKIGEGGMGVVHLARGADGRRVALKVLRPHVVGDQSGRERLAREVGALARVRSRYVAEVLDADPWGEIPYVATRYVPGFSVHDHVQEEGPITGTDLVWFAGCLAEGLDAVHAAGVLHRDVKPSNVLMEGRTPVLIDFGLARAEEDPRYTHTGWLLGTPGYLAPEVLYGESATAASDVHAWAATVAFAGTGRAPFGTGPTMAVTDRVRRGEHDLDGLRGDLGRVVAACLAPAPHDRPSLAELLAWLRPLTTRPQEARVAAPITVVRPLDTRTTPVPVATEPTVPLALVRQDDLPTDVHPLPPTRVDPGAAAVAGPAATDDLLPWMTEPYERDPLPAHWPQEWHDLALQGTPPAPPVPVGVRLRRGVLWSLGALVVAGAVAALPLLATSVVGVAVWLLRAGSAAGAAVSGRRERRGRRWYDAPWALVSAPWHLLATAPSTGVLLLWGGGAAAAAGLLCYAAAVHLATSLAVCGLVGAVATWAGPGGSLLRRPLARVVHPLAARGATWLVAAVALTALAGVVGWQASAGPDWTPAPRGPRQSDVPTVLR